MKLELRILDKQHRVNRSVQEAALRQFQKLERYLPAASHVDLRLDHVHRARKGRTHYAHVAVAIPYEATTFHVEVAAEDFRTALDRLYDKAERYLRKRHDRLIERSRSAERKERIAARISALLSAPKRLLRFPRRRPSQ
ncbi:MAG: HPF/RaiA family ribosome-associated protein [Patescibacteria group bacterium]